MERGPCASACQCRPSAGSGCRVSRRGARARPGQRIELQRRAAEQFLIGGHIDAGLELIREVLDRRDAAVAKSARGTGVARLASRPAPLARTPFLSRPPDVVDRDHLLRIDTCWSVITGLAGVDMIRAADLSAATSADGTRIR